MARPPSSMNHMRSTSAVRIATLIVMALLACQAMGQVPPRGGTAESDGFVIVPPIDTGQRAPFRLFGANCPGGMSPRNYQFIFDVPMDVPPSIRAVALRRSDFPGTPQTPSPAFTVTTSAFMAHATVRPSDFTYRFTTHRGADYQQVMATRVVNFGSIPWRADNNYPFSYRIPLDSPFRLRAGSSGLVELHVTASSLCLNQIHPAQGYVDFYAPRFPPGWGSWPAITIGQGCAPVGGTAPSIQALNPVLSIGQRGAWIILYEHQFVQAPTLLTIGLSNRALGTLALPYSLTNLGAPSCWIYNSIEATAPLLNNSVGFQTAAVAVPGEPGLVGMPIYVQGFRLHRSANALGLISTNALQLTAVPAVDTRMVTCKWSPSQGFGEGVASEGGPSGPVLLLDGR